jgi:hypothetical protein
LRELVKTKESLAYHGARLLLVIARCGKPRKSPARTLPGIVGRTLLAKLDFFVRYPSYLKKAAEILNRKGLTANLQATALKEMESVESRMVRYRYGPWDHVYYPALAYLLGKRLIEIQEAPGVEVFRLTAQGVRLADELASNDDFRDLAERAEAAYHLFNKYSGNRLKDFIYAYFPEVVNHKIGEKI